MATARLDTVQLGDLVIANPAASRILDRFGLDYCCHGNRTLVDASATADVDVEVVAARLGELAGEHRHDDTEWAEFEPQRLAHHILTTHHAYLHDELPLLDSLAAKVAQVHGARHPELVDVRRLVAQLRADLEPHSMKEERVLFPAIEALAAGQHREFPFGSIANPVRMMTQEHDRDGELLRELRTATSDYTVPFDGCASYRSLYERLEALEADTHQHILKENHVLFPAVLRMAEAA